MSVFSTVCEIGRGGFGVVDRVRDSRGKSFARKTFCPGPHIPADVHDKLRKRFKREVKIQAELGGNEIMPVLASDLDDRNPWFVMPLAEKTYECQIQEDRRTGKVDIDAIADILNGLQYLHDLGYVHRDLNPKNILLHEAHWKLSDLGAVLPPTGHTVTLTEGTVIYTEQYCSPEQRTDFTALSHQLTFMRSGAFCTISSDRHRAHPIRNTTRRGRWGSSLRSARSRVRLGGRQ